LNGIAVQSGIGNKLIPIKDENLIYVRQPLLIPPKEKNPTEGTGTNSFKISENFTECFD
jgi:hypothetical protein